MFANPTIQDFINREIGGPTPLSRPPPPTPGYRGSLARALLGDVTMPRIPPPLAVPAIEAFRRPIAQPLPSVGVNRGLVSQGGQEFGNRPPSVGTNASALTTGIENLGTGISGAIGDFAARRAQQQAYADALSGAPSRPAPFGSPPRPAPFGSAGLPSFARQAGVSPETPTTAEQFLSGIKAGEGVPYSGQSSTGAIGAYGLTGGFIKQWAPGAGLPTDRASYMNNPALQDQLATYAATQMHNQFGSWAPVANAWLTGSPTATTSAPGNMSPSAYVAKVMNAANAAGLDQAQDQRQDAADTARPVTTPQSVIPGQGNPHLPGFDPSAVPFTNTPIGPQGMLQAPTGMPVGSYAMAAPATVDPLAAALAGQGDPNAPPALAPGIVAALNNPFLFGGGQFGAG